MITRFKIFENYSEVEEYHLLKLEIMENGDLKISLTEDGKEEAEDGIDYNKFYDYWDDIQGNSEWLYASDLGDLNIGLMTSAPGVVDGINYVDPGEYEIYDDSNIYWYSSYEIKDFTEELVKNGYVIFDTTEPKTKEEIEANRLKKDINKYNV